MSAVGWRRSDVSSVHRQSSASPLGARRAFRRQASEGAERRLVSGHASPRANLVKRVSVAPPATPSARSLPSEDAQSSPSASLLPLSKEGTSQLARGPVLAVPTSGAPGRGLTRLEEATFALRQALGRTSGPTPRAVIPQGSQLQHGLATPTPLVPKNMQMVDQSLQGLSARLMQREGLQAQPRVVSRQSATGKFSVVEPPRSAQSAPVPSTPGVPFYEGRTSATHSASNASTPLGHQRATSMVMPSWRHNILTSPRTMEPPRPYSSTSISGGISPAFHSPQASYNAPPVEPPVGSFVTPQTSWVENVESASIWEPPLAPAEAPRVEAVPAVRLTGSSLPGMSVREPEVQALSTSLRMSSVCMSEPELLNAPGLQRMRSTPSASRVKAFPFAAASRVAAPRVLTAGSSPPRIVVANSLPMAQSSPPRGREVVVSPTQPAQAPQQRHSSEAAPTSGVRREVSVPFSSLVRVHNELQDILTSMSRTSADDLRVETVEGSVRRRLQAIESEFGGLLSPTTKGGSLLPSSRRSSREDTAGAPPPTASATSQVNMLRMEMGAVAGPADAAAGGPAARVAIAETSRRDSRGIPAQVRPETPTSNSMVKGVPHVATLTGRDGSKDSNKTVTTMRLDPPSVEAPTVFSEGCSDEEKYIELLIKRNGLEDRLGMDVRHCPPGQLCVIQIEPGSALERANQQVLAEYPQGEVLQVGDYIVQVNDITEPDSLMVKELLEKLELRIIVLRLLPSPQASPDNRAVPC